jgi:hypothetical protein
MQATIDIPEEIEFSETFRQRKDPNYGPPIDNDISEEIPVTESQEFRRRRNNESPELSKVVDETENNRKTIPDREEFTYLNKLLKGNKDEIEVPGIHYTHTKVPQFNARKSPKTKSKGKASPTYSRKMSPPASIHESNNESLNEPKQEIKAEQFKRTEILKKAEQPKKIEQPKKAEQSKKIEQPKKVEQPKKIEQPKKAEQYNNNETLNKIEQQKTIKRVTTKVLTDVPQTPQNNVSDLDITKASVSSTQERLTVNNTPKKLTLKGLVTTSKAVSSLSHKRHKSRVMNTSKAINFNEEKLLRGNQDEIQKLSKKDDANAIILKKLYRIHTKFSLVVDEDIEVDREKVHAKIKELKVKKDDKSIFNFGEKPDIDEYDGRVEREISKLNDKSYQDK